MVSEVNLGLGLGHTVAFILCCVLLGAEIYVEVGFHIGRLAIPGFVAVSCNHVVEPHTTSLTGGSVRHLLAFSSTRILLVRYFSLTTSHLSGTKLAVISWWLPHLEARWLRSYLLDLARLELTKSLLDQPVE